MNWLISSKHPDAVFLGISRRAGLALPTETRLAGQALPYQRHLGPTPDVLLRRE